MMAATPSAYLLGKRAEGKSPAEAQRCLMQHLATVVYRLMVTDAATVQPDRQLGPA